jgi:hypothetical protein
MVVFLASHVLCEVFCVTHVRDISLLDGELGALVGGIAPVVLLDHGSWSAQGVQSEKVVDDMVVKPSVVEEDVVYLSHVLA